LDILVHKTVLNGCETGAMISHHDYQIEGRNKQMAVLLKINDSKFKQMHHNQSTNNLKMSRENELKNIFIFSCRSDSDQGVVTHELRCV
jgi:hypothetical protein